MIPRTMLCLAALLFLGCGGGHLPATSGGLKYSDPDESEWRLLRAPANSPDRLELALVGPEGTRIRGASITLVVDDRQLEFVPYPDGQWIRDGGVLVTPPTEKPGEAKILQLRPALKQGNKLSVGLFQKDPKEPAKAATQPLFYVSLRSKGGLSGQSLSLVVRKAVIVPEDLSAEAPQPKTIRVAVGQLAVP